MAETEEKIDQGKLRQQYENNYLDTHKKLVRATATMLFPKSSGKRITEKTEE